MTNDDYMEYMRDGILARLNILTGILELVQKEVNEIKSRLSPAIEEPVVVLPAKKPKPDNFSVQYALKQERGARQRAYWAGFSRAQRKKEMARRLELAKQTKAAKQTPLTVKQAKQAKQLKESA